MENNEFLYYITNVCIKNRIRYLVSLHSDVTYIFSHYFPKIKFDSHDSLPVEKRLTLHVITLIKLVLNKDKKHYFYYIF